MAAVHANRRGRRYRYYLSRAKLCGKGEPGSLPRVSAGVLESFLARAMTPRLSASWRPELDDGQRVLEAVQRLTVGADRLEIQAPAEALRPDAETVSGDASTATLRLPFEVRRRQGAVILQAQGAPEPQPAKLDRALIRAVVLARSWAHELETGRAESIKALARREGLCNHYTARLLPLAYLAPNLVDQILAGEQPAAVSLGALTSRALPLKWADQRVAMRRLGRAAPAG